MRHNYTTYTMDDLDLLMIAFSIALILLGAVGTYLRRVSTADDPLAVEFAGLCGGGLMLAWMGIFKLIEYTALNVLLNSAAGVFLFIATMNGISIFVSIKIWSYYNPAWLIQNTPHDKDIPADSRISE
jgi:hypothetical protein